MTKRQKTRYENKETNKFEIKKRLSPLSFNLYGDSSLEEEGRMSGKILNNLRFADDTAIMKNNMDMNLKWIERK